MTSSRPGLAAGLMVLSVWCSAGKVLAQREAAGASGPPLDVPAHTPAPPLPVVRFAAEGITLVDAVQMTIERHPDIQRQLAAVAFGDGAVQEQTGAFDLTLLSTIGFEHRVQELTEARKQTERDKRSSLTSFAAENQGAADRARQLIPLIDQVRASGGSAASVQALAAVDPSLSNALALYDSLIASQAGSPAIASDLRDQRTSFINTTLGDFRSSLQNQVDELETVKQRLADLGPAPEDEVFYRTGFDVQFTKRFRNGVQFAPYIDGRDEGTNYSGKPRAEQFGGKGLEDLFTLHAGANVLVPLKRERGATIVAAGERAAMRERDAARAAAEHQAAVSALETVLTYWDARAARENVETAQRLVGIQVKLVQLTQQVIAAGDLPRVELSRAQAAQARSQAQLADAERQLYQARIALAAAMGVGATADDATVPTAHDDFPPVPDPAEPDTAALVTGAVGQRRDLAAAGEREQAGRILERAAAANTAMRLDLGGSAFFTALEERTFFGALDRWVGPSATLQLDLEKPLANNRLRGQLAQRSADASMRHIDAANLQRQIGLGVVQAAGSLSDTVARVREAEAAVGFYNDIAQAEITRFTAGEATLVDTVLVQQQQTEALLARTAARRDLARLVAQMRFETGTLLVGGSVAEPNLKTLPPAGTAR